LSDINGNHYIADLMGTIGLGALLTLASGSPDWVRREVGVLEAEVGRQIGADGVHHEHAIGYHRLVTEMIVHIGVALDHAGLELPTSLSRALTAMLDFLRVVAGPHDGEVPLIGDSDSGQILILDCASPNSVTGILEIGDALLRGPDGEPPADGSAAGWVLRQRRGAPVQRSLVLTPASQLFEPSGFVVLGLDESRVVVRAGPPGLQ